MDSILTTIKKMLGIEEDYEHFDTDIIVLINASFMKLMQLGIGPKSGFSIQDKTETWKDFLGERKDLENVRSYIYMDVRLIFDSPTPHYVAQAMSEQVKEIGWRLSIQADNIVFEENDLPEFPNDSVIPSDIEQRIAANEDNIKTLLINNERIEEKIENVSVLSIEARNIANQAAITAATAGERAELGIRLANEALDKINQ